MSLYAEILGDVSSSEPLVLIHGFGGSAAAWDAVRKHLPVDMPVIAYDLPGHRYSVAAEGSGGAGRMAKALLADLAQRDLLGFHLAGHSMGGAVASLMALRAGDMVKSLTLFAPGGMGPEIDADGLEAFAKAKSAEALRAELQKMVAADFVVPETVCEILAKERAMPGVCEALATVYGAMFAEGGAKEQGVIPRDMLAGLTMPARVYWGEQDPTLPFHQMAQMPDNFEKNSIPDVGHMLLDECPERVVAALVEAVGQI